MSANPFSLLNSQRFLPLFVTQFLGAFNDNVFKNALIILVTYRLAQDNGTDSRLMVAAAAGVFILPFFLFSATAGQLADKIDKARLIRFVKLAEIAVMSLSVIGFWLSSVWLLMAVLFLMGVQSTFFGPLKYGILPQHLEENELIGGNSLIGMATFLAILTGTIFGNLLILVEPGGPWIVSGTLVAMAVTGWAASRFIPQAPPSGNTIRLNPNFIGETWAMIRYAAGHRSVFLAILGISWFWLVGSVFLIQFPPYARDVLHADETVVTLFLTVFSIGVGIGALLTNKLLGGRVSGHLVPVAALGMSLFIVDLYRTSAGLSPSESGEYATIRQFIERPVSWRILFDMGMVAIFGGIYIIPLYALMQARSEAAHRARVIACNNIFNALFMVVASLAIMAMLALAFTIPQIFLTVGVVNAMVGLYMFKLVPDAMLKTVLKRLLQLCYRVEVEGLEHMDKAGKRALIVANHTSFIDGALLAAFLPERLTFAVNTHIAQRWWVKPALALVDAFPLDPTNPMATKTMIEEVRKDKHAVIFPEGRITVTGSLMKIYEGPGMIADKAEAQLVPVRIEGAQYTPFSRLRGKVRIQWFPKITLTILPPQDFEVPEDLKGRRRRKFIGQKLYDVMSGMMFASAHYHRTLFQALRDARATHGGRHVIAEDIERQPLSYNRLIRRSAALAMLLGREVDKEDCIGVLLPNATGTLVTFFALQKLGAIPAMLNFSTGHGNVISACKTALIKKVLTSRRFIEQARLEEMAEAVEKECELVYLEDLRETVHFGHKLRAFPAPWIRSNREKPVEPDDPAVVLFTSGSEGAPKGVVLSHTNLRANHAQLAARVDFSINDTVFNALPMFHSFGLSAATLLPVLAGIRTFFYPSPLHYRIVPELIYDTNASIMFGTDTFLSGYAKFAHPYDFYSVRYIFAGAEKLRDETRRAYAETYGVRIFEGYGATETGPVLSTNTPMHNRPGTVGRFLPGIEYKLDTVEGIEEGGRLEVTGPNVMLGYLKSDDPGLLVPPKTDNGSGWYDTGDIVSVSEEGYITIQGRAKRFAKIGGEMVSLKAAEELAEKTWPEHTHAVIALPDPKKGEQLILVTDCEDASREELTVQAKMQGVGEITVPRKVHYMEKLPVLGTGKTDLVSLKEQMEKEYGES